MTPSFLHLGSTPISSIGQYNTKIDSNTMATTLDFKPSGHYWEYTERGKNSLFFFVNSDLVIGEIFGASLKNLSVVTFYATVVLAIGRLIRGVFEQIIMRVIYEEMPYCDDIIEFCDAIFMARRDGDLRREQRLYELLIRMYRSPEMLINLTKEYLKYKNFSRVGKPNSLGK